VTKIVAYNFDEQTKSTVFCPFEYLNCSLNIICRELKLISS